MRLPNWLRRTVFRQRYRKHIRRDQEAFLREHPELRVPVERGTGHWPVPEEEEFRRLTEPRIAELFGVPLYLIGESHGPSCTVAEPCTECRPAPPMHPTNRDLDREL